MGIESCCDDCCCDCTEFSLTGVRLVSHEEAEAAFDEAMESLKSIESETRKFLYRERLKEKHPFVYSVARFFGVY